MRLQPVEIHPKIQGALDVWSQFQDEKELQQIFIVNSEKFDGLFDHLNQAVIMWSISHVLKEIAQSPELLNDFRPLPSVEDKSLSFLLQASKFSDSSIVFRTYVSVVLGRSEKLVGCLAQMQKAVKSKHLSAAIKLVRNDEVRILRNSIGHGTYLASGQVLEYSDRRLTRQISYRELDSLNFAIWTIVLMVWAVVGVK